MQRHAAVLPSTLLCCGHRAGSRLVGVFCGSLIVRTGLLPHLALQLHALGLLRRNTTLCASTLLSHTLTAGRIRSMMRVLELGFLAGKRRSAAQHGAAQRSTAQHSAAQPCRPRAPLCFCCMPFCRAQAAPARPCRG